MILNNLDTLNNKLDDTHKIQLYTFINLNDN